MLKFIYLCRYWNWCTMVIVASSDEDVFELYRNTSYPADKDLGWMPHFSGSEIDEMKRDPGRFRFRRIGYAEHGIPSGPVNVGSTLLLEGETLVT